LLTDDDSAPTSPVVITEIAIGVEAVGEFVSKFVQLVGAMVAAEPGKLTFGFLASLDVDEVGQPLTEAPNDCHVTVTDGSGALRLSGGR
jgi:hypothetical protein